MSPGAQSIGQMCSLLIQKVVQSTEPEACAVYKSGQSWVTPNQDPGLDGHLSTRQAMSSTHGAQGKGKRGRGTRKYGVSDMQLRVSEGREK